MSAGTVEGGFAMQPDPNDCLDRIMRVDSPVGALYRDLALPLSLPSFPTSSSGKRSTSTQCRREAPA